MDYAYRFIVKYNTFLIYFKISVTYFLSEITLLFTLVYPISQVNNFSSTHPVTFPLKLCQNTDSKL